MIFPQDGVGGCAPIPRKLRPLSTKIAEAKLAADITIIGAMTLGNIWLKIILVSENPKAFDASTNSFSIYYRICPRSTRATSTHIVSPTAINICQNPFPIAKVIAITNSNVGIDHTTFINHIIMLSVRPL